MKVIIAGSRTFTDYSIVEQAIKDSGFEITQVVSGAAHGVDTLGQHWAQRNGKTIKFFPAKWKTHGKAAGPIRNREMAEYAEALIAIWDGESRGTANMIKNAQELGLKCHVKNLKETK